MERVYLVSREGLAAQRAERRWDGMGGRERKRVSWGLETTTRTARGNRLKKERKDKTTLVCM